MWLRPRFSSRVEPNRRLAAWRLGVVLAAAAWTLASCGSKVWDDEPVRVISADGSEICFHVPSEARDLCMPPEDAGELADLEPGTCARIDSYKNTGDVDTADPVDCVEVDLDDVGTTGPDAPTTTSATDPPNTDGFGSTSTTAS